MLKALKQQMTVQEFVLYDSYISIRENNVPHAIAGLSALGEEFTEPVLRHMLTVYENSKRERCFRDKRMTLRMELLEVTIELTARLMRIGEKLNMKVDFTGKAQDG